MGCYQAALQVKDYRRKQKAVLLAFDVPNVITDGYESPTLSEAMKWWGVSRRAIIAAKLRAFA